MPRMLYGLICANKTYIAPIKMLKKKKKEKFDTKKLVIYLV